MAAWAELLGENSAVDGAWTLLVLATSLLALLLAHAQRRRLDRLEATLQRQSLLLGAKLADASGTSRAQDLAPTTSIIVQVSQTNAPGCPVFVASAEAPLGSSPPPALAQGQDASTVINAALSMVYPAEMNGQVGSVRLLPGHYPLATPLVIGRSLALTGSVGVVLEAAVPGKPMGPLITVTASNVVLRDLELDGAAPGTGSPKTGGGAVAGVSIQGPLSRVLVENVSVSNVSGSAISAVINTQNAPTGGAQTAITVRGCTVDRCGMGGIGLAKRGPLPSPGGSTAAGAAPLITSSGHMVTGNRISRTGSHAVCLTGVCTSQVICNQMTHVSIYNSLGVFGHGIAIDGNCGNDPVETVVITGNIIDTVHMPANKRNASCTGIEIADAINGAVCAANRVRAVAMGYGVYFGGGIAPSSHGVIANNAIEGANGYGVWVNARGQHSAKFPNGSAGPTVGAAVVGNCLRDNAPAGVRCDNVSDETVVGNVVSNSDGAAGLMLVGGNHRAAVVGNVSSGGGGDVPSEARFGLLVQPTAPPSDATHTIEASTGKGLVDVCVRANVAPDAGATSKQGVSVAGSAKPTPDDTRTFAPSAGDSVAVGGNQCAD